ncbi:MAG: glycoside hydrolase family 3 N-terminal domain-containing protein, partial [Alphaproteobacteria bacterium]
AEQKRQAELKKKAELKRQAELKKQAELKRQAELKKQAELKRQAEEKKQAKLKKQLNTWVGQMLMVGFKGQKPNEPGVKKLAKQIKSGAVGGVVFLSHNIVSPKQVAKLTAAFHRKDDETPTFIAVDQEGGIVQRLSHKKGFAEYPTANALGKRNDPLTAYEVYKGMAHELLRYGFNLNMGPVVDLQRKDTNSIIAIKERAFGSKPRHVTAFAKAFCAAHHDAGVLTVLKHFPGHGSTTADTHTDPADISKTWSKDELLPYRKLIKSGDAEIIMVGHLTHAKMADKPGMPASLSKKAVTDKLRKELKFTGVVISDDLEMTAVRKKHPLEDSVIRAINAGVDIILLGNQIKPSADLPERVAEIIRKAVADGKLKRERLKTSYERILAVKRKLKGQQPKAIASANEHADNKGTTTPAGR